MLDFLVISTRTVKRGLVEIYPNFKIKNPSSDLMIRGGDFYAVWVEELGIWSTNEQDLIDMVDKEVDTYASKYKAPNDESIRVLHMWDSSSGVIDMWHKYCQKQMRDAYTILDEKLIFANDPVNKKDYASKRLTYPLEEGETPAWDKLVSTLYSEEERHKIEWAIGAIVSGESKNLQKFLVFYGAPGTGKSTILNIIQDLFNGYWAAFDSKALGSNNNAFALESFKNNPLVSIQHEGDLSKIEDNSVINSLTSHETMMVNEKFKSAYPMKFNAFLMLGTNKPVKITDAKSGLIRRLIDVHPSGNKLGAREYKSTTKQVAFELGAIAYKCKKIFLDDPSYYDGYMPLEMMGSTNDFYNFVIDNYHVFKKEDGTTLKVAWEMYKNYCEEAQVPFKSSKMRFKEELKNYFRDYADRFDNEDGSQVRSYYSGFRTDKFEEEKKKVVKAKPKIKLLEINSTESIFDSECADCAAQYATTQGDPAHKWVKVKTKLKDLNTSELHYVKVPENHIVIDFDIKDENGKKSLELNLAAAALWPATYAELSKSGNGVHLHYIYNGDTSRLSRIYDENIEVKVFTGNSSLRRKLTKCNDIPIATISSGLPLKEDAKVINKDVVQTEKGLRTTIKKCLNKEVHANTRCNIDFINDILNKAYDSGLTYDVSDMKNDIFAFAAQSSHQAEYCIKLVGQMKFQSEEMRSDVTNNEADFVFFDIEVFPNLLLVNWKAMGEGKPMVRMINPSPEEIAQLSKFNLIGFNCRRYDNHILYARMIGYSIEQLYELSQKIINSNKGAKGVFFGEAYNFSYTDIYDFASAGNKKSLKKLEIEMGIHHKELGIPWDKPVPEERWVEVAEYCDNDVIATEAAFTYLQADWTARQILSDIANMSVNDTTNTLTTRVIFGTNKTPQNEFCYRDMSKPVNDIPEDVKKFLAIACPEMMAKEHVRTDLGVYDESYLPYFPGYKYEAGVSTYRGETVGEGGYVYAEPGMYGNVALLDIASMHPHSLIAECLFGTRYTEAFRSIVEGRVSIKHEDWDAVNNMLDGKMTKFVKRVIDGELTSKQLADALKTAINSVYGLTSATFDNPFNDPRNKDNIVAKRGALFMIDLKHEVQKRGFTVAHIKTDSIKIPDATPEIIQFVMDFGRRYGYTFEHEATYDRMCLVNDAVYIAKYKDGKHAGEWTATGKQFAVPYVFKSLFSREPIEFNDVCETFSVSTALYLDMNEKLGADEHDYKFVGKVGSFCPIAPGFGGGELVREGTDKEGNIKYSSATGAKGYRWFEAELVSEKIGGTTKIIDIDTGEEKEVAKLGLADDARAMIDISYYNKLVDDAIDSISQYGDFEWFISDDPYVKSSDCDFETMISDVPWVAECGKDTCFGCPHFNSDPFNVSCGQGYDVSDRAELIDSLQSPFDVR